MTIEERAENIVCRFNLTPLQESELKKEIAAEIQTAVDETLFRERRESAIKEVERLEQAKAEALEEAEKQCDRDCLKVKIRAYEEAAKIADEFSNEKEQGDEESSQVHWVNYAGRNIASEIRARAKEIK